MGWQRSCWEDLEVSLSLPGTLPQGLLALEAQVVLCEGGPEVPRVDQGPVLADLDLEVGRGLFSGAPQ